jgi:GTP-binding protein
LTSPSIKGGGDQDTLPLVAIVGRPNVGKSTLFNRFVRRRQAITDPTPGVTRDPVRGVWEWEGKRVLLVDTGGIRSGAEGMEALVAQKSVETFRRADCIILLLDISGLTGEDEELIGALRPYSSRVILAVNKADTEEKEDALGDCWALGFSSLIPVSSAHGRNCDTLAEAVFRRIDFSRYAGREAVSPREDITIAILGKPNTGKSTLVNRLLGEELSIVSDVPGTTRDIQEGRITFKKKTFRLLDTAGIRRKSHVTENVEYYSVNRAIATIAEADVVFLLIDAEEGLAEQDKKIAAQIVKKGRGVILVLNKWDLMPEGKKILKAAEERLRFQFPALDFAPVLAVSAKTGWNIESLLTRAGGINLQLERRIETGILNRALEGWVGGNPPPRDGRRQFKIRFITQVKTKPLRFVLFVNRKEGFPSSYFGYIKNRIRSDFGFRDVPIDIEVRTKDRG